MRYLRGLAEAVIVIALLTAIALLLVGGCGS